MCGVNRRRGKAADLSPGQILPGAGNNPVQAENKYDQTRQIKKRGTIPDQYRLPGQHQEDTHQGRHKQAYPRYICELTRFMDRLS